jgi:hypothetical protein
VSSFRGRSEAIAEGEGVVPAESHLQRRLERPIPVFRLYGEVAGATVPGFVHAERIGTPLPAGRGEGCVLLQGTQRGDSRG